MASPAIGGGNPRVPRQPGVPELIVDPIAPGLKKPNPRMPKQRIKLAKPMRNVGGIKFGTPGAKMVDRIYNTY